MKHKANPKGYECKGKMSLGNAKGAKNADPNKRKQVSQKKGKPMEMPKAKKLAAKP